MERPLTLYGISVTDWISAIAAFVMAGAVILQYLMWRVMRRQAEISSKPRIRLKPRLDSSFDEIQRGKERSVSTGAEPAFFSTHPLLVKTLEQFQADIETEWETHVAVVDASLTTVPDTLIGFDVHNIGGALTSGFTMVVNLEVSGHPNDKATTCKKYTRTLVIEEDIRPGGFVFVAVLRGRFIFNVNFQGRITKVRDELGGEEVLRSAVQPVAAKAFENEALVRTLTKRAIATPEQKSI